MREGEITNAVQIQITHTALAIVILCSDLYPMKIAVFCSLLFLVPGQRENENLLASW